ncbi:MAG: TrmH family RNA methyltransferase [Victivallales bacterium]|nr:TrmH family RNA methyltransferase [Victivallales bacterium]
MVVVQQGDSEQPRTAGTLPVVVVLDNLRSAYNVGNIFRVAEATRAEKIIACGYTAAPPHEKLEKTARGCDRLVPCEHAETSAEAVRALQAQGYHVYAVETVQEAPLYWEAEIAFPAALVLGNEALGIAPDALELCDGFLALPALGQKNSINVGNCASVILFDCVRRIGLAKS